MVMRCHKNHLIYLLLCVICVLSLVFFCYYNQDNTDPQQYEEQTFFDESAPPSNDDVIASVSRSLPFLPFAYFYRHFMQQPKKNNTCAPFPHLLELKFHNSYWQRYDNLNLTYYLYGAYYDTRPSITTTPLVRILAMVNQLGGPYPASYCQVWFEETLEPTLVPVKQHLPIWHLDWGISPNLLYPTLITCALPDDIPRWIPQAVSLVSAPCAFPHNNLRVHYEPLAANTSKAEFAVCVKGTYFPYADQSARLVEWMELVHLFGVSKVNIYNLEVHPHVSKVFDYYSRLGWLEVRRLTLARGEPQEGHFSTWSIQMDEMNNRLNQVLALNDCFYRHMYRYEYIAMQDTDELIMPLGHYQNWSQLVRIGREQTPPGKYKAFAAICFRNVYFPPDEERRRVYREEAPWYLYMLQHVHRVAMHSPVFAATKCLHDTNALIGVHNHFPMYYAEEYFQHAAVNESVAQLQHYRQPEVLEMLEEMRTDDNIWRFKEPLVERTVKVLRELGFVRMVKLTKRRGS